MSIRSECQPKGMVRLVLSFPFLLTSTVIAAWLLALWGVQTMRVERARGPAAGCRGNLKNLGIAMEMYRVDFRDYPPGRSHLTPNYLKYIPECPAAGSVTYVVDTGKAAQFNPRGGKGNFLVVCAGRNHSLLSIPPDYPRYQGVGGVADR